MSYFKNYEQMPKDAPIYPARWSVLSDLPVPEQGTWPVVQIMHESAIVWLDPGNTLIVTHDECGDFEHMDHILVDDKMLPDGPLYIFPTPEDANPTTDEEELITYDVKFDSLVCDLRDSGFLHKYVPGRPNGEVFEHYYRFIRSNIPFEEIARLILESEIED